MVTGSTEMNGAKRAMIAIPARMMRPPTSVGLRLTKRHVFAPLPGATIDLPAASAVACAISVPNARIEHSVAQIDEQIDDHVDPGEHQDHTLDDRIIALCNGIDHKPPNARNI